MNSGAPETYFPELDGDDRRQADEWLHEVLRLVLRIHRDHLERHALDYPQRSLDNTDGTGTLSTPDPNLDDGPPV